MSEKEFISGIHWLMGYMAAIEKHGILDNKDHPEYFKAVEVSRFAIRLIDECNKVRSAA